MAPKAAHYDKTGEFPAEIFKKAWELGLVNTHVPKIAGGMELGAIEGVLIGEALAWGYVEEDIVFLFISLYIHYIHYIGAQE